MSKSRVRFGARTWRGILGRRGAAAAKRRPRGNALGNAALIEALEGVSADTARELIANLEDLASRLRPKQLGARSSISSIARDELSLNANRYGGGPSGLTRDILALWLRA